MNKSSLLEKFPERLRNLRIEKNLSQEGLSELIQAKTRSTISHYESGKRDPVLTNIYMIAMVLDVNIPYLIGASDTRKKFSEG